MLKDLDVVRRLLVQRILLCGRVGLSHTVIMNYNTMESMANVKEDHPNVKE